MLSLHEQWVYLCSAGELSLVCVFTVDLEILSFVFPFSTRTQASFLCPSMHLRKNLSCHIPTILGNSSAAVLGWLCVNPSATCAVCAAHIPPPTISPTSTGTESLLYSALASSIPGSKHASILVTPSQILPAKWLHDSKGMQCLCLSQTAWKCLFLTQQKHIFS